MTVKPQGLSLSKNNRNLPGLKPLGTQSIAPSSGNRFSALSGPRKMAPFSQMSPVKSLGIEKSKFVNGGNRNPEVKVEGNLSKGPGFGFLPGLMGGSSGSSKPIETKKFVPSSARTTKLGSSQTAQKRYGAFDTAASAPSAYEPPERNTPSRGPGGFGGSFGDSFQSSQAPESNSLLQKCFPKVLTLFRLWFSEFKFVDIKF